MPIAYLGVSSEALNLVVSFELPPMKFKKQARERFEDDEDDFALALVSTVELP